MAAIERVSAQFRVCVEGGAYLEFGFENARGVPGGLKDFGEYIGTKAQEEADRLLRVDDSIDRCIRLEREKVALELELAKLKAKGKEAEPVEEPKTFLKRRGRPPKRAATNGDS